MMINTLRSASRAMERSALAADSQQRSESLNKQITELSEHTRQLEELLDRIGALQKAAADEPILSAEILENLRTAVDECSGQLSQSMPSLEAGAVRALKAETDITRNAAGTFWKNFADRECTPVTDNLRSLGGLLEHPSEAADLANRLSSAGGGLPTTVKKLNSLLEDLRKGRQMLDQLQFESDAEVKAFVDQVRQQKATVRDLTPHILEWLQEHHLTNKIRLRFNG